VDFRLHYEPDTLLTNFQGPSTGLLTLNLATLTGLQSRLLEGGVPKLQRLVVVAAGGIRCLSLRPWISSQVCMRSYILQYVKKICYS